MAEGLARLATEDLNLIQVGWLTQGGSLDPMGTPLAGEKYGDRPVYLLEWVE